MNKEWDIFLSHATEDKDKVARPLNKALEERDLKVWFDETEHRIGDRVRRKIDQGIARSAFGVAILSPAYFAGHWTMYELDQMLDWEVRGKFLVRGKLLLPIWHNLAEGDIPEDYSYLSGMFAGDTSKSTIEELADEIYRVVTS